RTNGGARGVEGAGHATGSQRDDLYPQRGVDVPVRDQVLRRPRRGGGAAQGVFNWVRVWATWAACENDVSAVDAEGNPRKEFLKKLQRLVAACDQQGGVVDMTLSRGNDVNGPARLQTLETHRRAVEVIVTALKGRRNWYLDLGNERSV